WDLSRWGCFRSVASHPIAVEQLQRVVQPRPTPPLPTEALLFPGVRHVAPDLFLNPVFDVAEALAGVPDREVVHPPPKHRIDQADDPVNRLRPVSAEHVLDLPQKRRSLFELWRILRPHRSAQTAEVAEVEPQKAEALASFEVDRAALFIIDFNLQLGELLPEAFGHG